MIPPQLAAHNMGLKPQSHTSEYSTNIIVKKIPCFGRLHFVKDKNGIMSLGFVCLYWIYGTWCTLSVILLPRLRDGQASEPFVFLFCVTSVMCIAALFRAATLNPGRVPLVTNESTTGFDIGDWEMCQKCMRKRPPRAHHCRRCQQCVLRMDHHCPWINNCVGEENHWAFMQLLFWAFCLGFLAFFSCMLHFWYYPKCNTCDKDIFYIKHGILFTYLLTLLGVFMMIFMGFNLIGQHFNITMDRTTLDNMKDPRPDIDKINIRTEFVAYNEICGGGWMLLWLLPCRRRKQIRSSYYYSNPV